MLALGPQLGVVLDAGAGMQNRPYFRPKWSLWYRGMTCGARLWVRSPNATFPISKHISICHIASCEALTIVLSSPRRTISSQQKYVCTVESLGNASITSFHEMLHACCKMWRYHLLVRLFQLAYHAIQLLAQGYLLLLVQSVVMCRHKLKRNTVIFSRLRDGASLKLQLWAIRCVHEFVLTWSKENGS